MIGWLLAALLAGAGAGANDPGAHPHVRTLERWREAREAGDVATLRALLAPDSRIWFGTREGPGRPRDPGGGGPWAAWDATFRSRTEVLAHEVDGDVVRTTVREINDWYRLVERPASTYFITTWFDARGRIEGTLIHAPPDREEPPEDRLDAFVAWARRERPGLIDRLMPEGAIDPGRAEEWKRALLDWRRSEGLGNPLDPPDGGS